MYNHNLIEKKWQKFWKKNCTFKTKFASKNRKKNVYVLEMFPYPSGKGLHVGHIEGYTAGDVLARYKRLRGFNVLHPIGWDAFGLPAEQFAVKTGNNPAKFTETNIKSFKNELESMGFSYDYELAFSTTDPKYFKWTQWIFLQFYKKGLAKYQLVNVNWCPELKTVLANEEVYVNARKQTLSKRGDFLVVQKPMKQWILKITKYAEKLLIGLDKLDWPSSVVTLQKNWIGLNKNNFKKTHLKDWVFSRQRFWGEPFPMYFTPDGKTQTISKLPVLLPHWKPTILKETKGAAPLDNFNDWVYFRKKNQKMRRETNTMPQWAGSSWYYLAYILRTKNGFTPLNSKKAYTKLKNWLPVDIYVGGQEHAVLHLLYARFWHKFLYDIKVVPTTEPFFKFVKQGMLLGNDGHKMSKSRNNGVSPKKIIKDYGADTLRVYELFMGPLSDDKKWSDAGLHGIWRWLARVYRLVLSVKIVSEKNFNFSFDFRLLFNKTIRDVTTNLDTLKYNLAISNLMVFTNYFSKQKKVSKKVLIAFLVMLSPFAPHVANELVYKVSKKDVGFFNWPRYDAKQIRQKQVLIVEVNGKMRGKLVYPPWETVRQKAVLTASKKLPRVQKYLKDKKIKQIIYVENKVVNFVV